MSCPPRNANGIPITILIGIRCNECSDTGLITNDMGHRIRYCSCERGVSTQKNDSEALDIQEDNWNVDDHAAIRDEIENENDDSD